MLLASCFLFNFCSDSVSKFQDSDTKGYTIYNQNPFEWVGLYHNEIVGFVRENYSSPYFSGTWPDVNYQNEILNYTAIAMDSLYQIDTDSVITDGEPMFDLINNKNLFLITYRNNIINNSNFTPNDMLYSIKVLDLSIEILDSLYEPSIAFDKIILLENEILSQSWNLQNEGLALYSIGLYKNSYNFWSNIYEPTYKIKSSYEVQGKVDRVRIGANGCVDYCVGAGTFLAATGGSGGVGAAAGVWAGVKAGAAASAAADWLGSLAGWW